MSRKYEPQVETGVFGIGPISNAALLTIAGLYAEQHRGKKTTGIAAADATSIQTVKGIGSVADTYDEIKLQELSGKFCMGHVRFSRSWDVDEPSIQPITMRTALGPLSIILNGHLTNVEDLKKGLVEEGAIFTTSSQAEIVLHLMARSKKTTIIEALKHALSQIQGAYIILLLSPGSLMAARDSHGFLPLSVGKFFPSEGTCCTVLSTETCSFDMLEQNFGLHIGERSELLPGHIIAIENDSVLTEPFCQPTLGHCCSNQLVFLASASSYMFGKPVATVRERLGIELGRQNTTPADVIIPMSSVAFPIANGFSETSRIPLTYGVIRNEEQVPNLKPLINPPRTSVKARFFVVDCKIRGKKVIVILHHLFTGRSCKELVSLLRDHGALEVHVKVPTPPTVSSCLYGTDIPMESELLARSMTLANVAGHLGADSIAFLPTETFQEVMSSQDHAHCFACFTGEHPKL